MYFHIKDTCVCCAGCAMDCPTQAITRKGERYVIHQDMCIHCGDCYAICPVGAVQMVKEKDLDTNK
ncbi:4Fe-4S binding protein [Veillonella sp. VA142]|uniref:4Fe-4S binding protein n=1 Tax=Veillonella sp. VA142 TaxID=741834 RepID=UPI000F8F021B|nr:4Fe-4S dicluster domain-containing protein [Veillonella sp. VA142]